jgi:hypothetical protein
MQDFMDPAALSTNLHTSMLVVIETNPRSKEMQNISVLLMPD